MSLAPEELADRIRAILPPAAIIREQKMFGGIAFMLNGNMLVAPLKDGSMLVRVGKDGMTEALKRPGASIMEMGGRSMGGFLEVSGDALEDEDSLIDWVNRARDFVLTLPAK